MAEKEERTGILSNIRYYNKKARDAGNKFVRDQSNQYKNQASDAYNSYEPFVKNNKSHNTFLKKIFGEDNKFLNKIDQYDKKLDQAGYMAQDLGGMAYNAARDGASIATDVALGGYGLAKDVAKEFNQNFLGIGDGAEGFGQATKTLYEDTLGDAAYAYLPKAASDYLGSSTDMRKDAMLAGYKYSPFAIKKDGSQPGKITFDSWKNSTGFNTTLNADRINMLTEKDLKSYTPDVAFPEYKSWLNSDEFKSYDPTVQTEMLSDRKKLFDVWYDETVKDKRNFFDSKNEWKVAGPEYAKWASQDYQNEMLSKYGKYDLEITDLNPNISPYEDVDVKLNLANNDYMEAYKAAGGFENADPNDIGRPTEFDYGFFDRSPVEGGPGLTTAENDRAVLGFMKPYKYNTTEAETFANNPINLIPELIIGSKGLGTLSNKFNKGFQGVKGSRAAREIFPGMLQYGDNDFGSSKKNIGSLILNNFRRKGGQFAVAGATADYLSDD